MYLPSSDSDSSSSSSSQSTSTTRRVPYSKHVRRKSCNDQQVRQQLAEERKNKVNLVVVNGSIIETKDNLIVSLRTQLYVSSDRYAKRYHNQARFDVIVLSQIINILIVILFT